MASRSDDLTGASLPACSAEQGTPTCNTAHHDNSITKKGVDKQGAHHIIHVHVTARWYEASGHLTQSCVQLAAQALSCMRTWATHSSRRL
jgi:hypothetical protein